MNRLLLTIFLLLFLQTNIEAQMRYRFDPDKIPAKWAIKINILSGFAATLNLSLERLPENKYSMQNGISVTQATFSSDNRKPNSVFILSDVFDYRIYKNAAAKGNGRYRMAFARLSYLNIKDYRQDSLTQNKIINIEERMSGLALGYCWGYQRIYRKKFLLDVYAGISMAIPFQYYCNMETDEIEKYELRTWQENPMTQGFGLRMGIKAGYLF